MHSALSGLTDWILRYIKTTFTCSFFIVGRGSAVAGGALRKLDVDVRGSKVSHTGGKLVSYRALRILG